MENEVWKDIPDYEGLYQASNLGRIKSLSRRVKSKGGWRIIKEKILKPYKKKNRRMSIDLGKRNTKSVHRLVAMSFIENPFNKPQVNHIDGNPSNNELSNLEWCTQSENQLHAYRTGLQVGFSPKGIDNKNSKYFYKYDMSLNLISKEFCIKEYARNLKVNPTSIHRVLSGKRKSHHGFIYSYTLK